MGQNNPAKDDNSFDAHFMCAQFTVPMAQAYKAQLPLQSSDSVSVVLFILDASAREANLVCAVDAVLMCVKRISEKILLHWSIDSCIIDVLDDQV